jgi:hypothetical protein
MAREAAIRLLNKENAEVRGRHLGVLLSRDDSAADYLPRRYAVHCESAREVWPAENVFMQLSSV